MHHYLLSPAIPTRVSVKGKRFPEHVCRRCRCVANVLLNFKALQTVRSVFCAKCNAGSEGSGGVGVRVGGASSLPASNAGHASLPPKGLDLTPRSFIKAKVVAQLLHGQHTDRQIPTDIRSNTQTQIPIHSTIHTFTPT